MKPPQSSKPIALGVLAILGVVALSALWMGYDLIRTLIRHPGESATLAVFVGLIGGILSICTGAIGFVGGMLSATEKPQPQTTIAHADNAQTGSTNNNASTATPASSGDKQAEESTP